MAPLYMRMLGLGPLDDYLMERVKHGQGYGQGIVRYGQNGERVEKHYGKDGKPYMVAVRPKGQHRGDRSHAYAHPLALRRPRSANDLRNPPNTPYEHAPPFHYKNAKGVGMHGNAGYAYPPQRPYDNTDNVQIPENAVYNHFPPQPYDMPHEQRPTREHDSISHASLNDHGLRHRRRNRSAGSRAVAGNKYADKIQNMFINNCYHGSQRRPKTSRTFYSESRSSYASSETSSQYSTSYGPRRHNGRTESHTPSTITSWIRSLSPHPSAPLLETPPMGRRRRSLIRTVSPSIASSRTTTSSNSTRSTPSTAASSVSGTSSLRDHRCKVPGSYPSERDRRAPRHEQGHYGEQDHRATRDHHTERDRYAQRERRDRPLTSFEEDYISGARREGRQLRRAHSADLADLQRERRRQGF